jgi:hypothetical protein
MLFPLFALFIIIGTVVTYSFYHTRARHHQDQTYVEDGRSITEEALCEV